ncbi:IS21 family transposase, partial [Enorma phocaeensis]|nr:IS21 family transposase [Enorma phocaeensis]
MYDVAVRLGGVPADRGDRGHVVGEPLGGDGRRARDPRVERFSREAGFRIVLCAPRTPQTKGKV